MAYIKTLKRYFNNFLDVMPKRIKVLKKTLKKKAQYEGWLRGSVQQGSPFGEDLKSQDLNRHATWLLECIGEDKLFQKKRKQSLMFYAHKVQKSLAIFEKRIPEINARVEKMKSLDLSKSIPGAKAKPFYSNAELEFVESLNPFFETVGSYSCLLEKQIAVYEEESEALKDMLNADQSFKSYKALWPEYEKAARKEKELEQDLESLKSGLRSFTLSVRRNRVVMKEIKDTLNRGSLARMIGPAVLLTISARGYGLGIVAFLYLIVIWINIRSVEKREIKIRSF